MPIEATLFLANMSHEIRTPMNLTWHDCLIARRMLPIIFDTAKEKLADAHNDIHRCWSQYSAYQTTETSWNWHVSIRVYC